MFILSVTYPNREGATFDWDHYRQTHLPMAGEIFARHGMGYASVLKGESNVDGSPPALLAHAVFSFRTEDGARAALADPDCAGLIADIPNFTDVTPVIQFNSAIP